MFLSPVMTIMGWSLTLLSALMIIPSLFALDGKSEIAATAFFISSLITLFIGGALIFAGREEVTTLNRRNTFLLALLIWLILPVFAALPLYMSEATKTYIDAYFEALSGFTTNGASVIQNLDDMPRAVILWRAQLQWFGGFALIILVSVLATTVNLPGSSPLSRAIAKSSRRRLSRRIRYAVLSILGVYAILTGLCIVMLWFSGMSAFNALCYGLTTLSTGGFTTSAGAHELFENRFTEIVLMVFMFIGAINFALHWAFFNGNRRSYLENPEYRYLVYVTSIVALAMILMMNIETNFGFLETVRYSLFNSISFLSTTGYVMSPVSESGEFYWPVGSLMILFIAMTIGGSTGSTAGGVKLMRVALLMKLVIAEVRSLSFPSAIVVMKYAKEAITKDHILAIWAFFTFYIFTILLVSLGLSLTGLEVKGALALASANLANVGAAISFPMFGHSELTTMTSTYFGLPDMAKILLCFTMLIGRLEFFVVLALFNPALWKR